MEHLEIIANCKGDGISAISSCLKLAEAYKKDIILNFREGYSIKIRPNSHEQDLISIMLLENKIIGINKKLEELNKKNN